VGTLFLDRNLLIKRFTPPVTRLFNLIEKDIGRPIADITSNLVYENFLADVRDVLENLNKKEVDVKMRDGRWFSVRMLPYRNSQNVIDGVVVTFGDVTRLKETEIKALRAQVEAAGVMQSVPHPLVVLDHELCVRAVNPAFCDMFHVGEKEAAGRPFFTLQGARWTDSGLEQDLRELLEKGGGKREYEVQASDGGKRIGLTARRVEGQDKQPVLVLLIDGK
jgi:two-component system CheB/CheR fusion protein